MESTFSTPALCTVSPPSGRPVRDRCNAYRSRSPVSWVSLPGAPEEESSSPRTSDSRSCKDFLRDPPQNPRLIPVNTRRTLVGLHLLEGFHYLTLAKYQTALLFHRGLLPLPVGPILKLDSAAPLLHPITGPSSLVRAAPPLCPASVLSSSWVLHLDFSLIIGATGSHVPHKSLDQVRAAFMPDAARAVSRFSPGLIPGQRLPPGFDIVPTLSTRHQRFTHVRLPVPYLTRSRLAFSPTLTTMALNHSSLGWFGASPCRAAPRGLPSSSVRLCVAHNRPRT